MLRIEVNSTRLAGIALLLFVAIATPPLRQILESRMTTQMLLQLPMLVLIGWWLSGIVPQRLRVAIGAWNQLGITGLLLATAATAYWMLPRSLDASVSQPWMDVAKYVSIPLLIGLPFALSWPRMNFIVRGVFLLEFIASFLRLGWLYMTLPDRLCSNYLLNDQRNLGQYMLIISALLTLWMAWKLLWGRFETTNG